MTITRQSLEELAEAADLLNRAAYPTEDIGVGERLAIAVGDQLRRFGGRLSRDVVIQMRAIETESGTGSTLLAAGQPQLAPFQRRLFLRAVVPVLPTSEWMTPFVRELSPLSGEGGASGVAETSTKPDMGSTLAFEQLPNTPGTLAADCTVSEQLMADAPAFVKYVNTRLPYLLKVREEIAMIGGNGEVVNGGITGILHTPGVDTSATGTDLPGAIVAAAGKVAGNGVLPDIAIVNAADYWTAYEAAPVFFDADSLRLTLIPTTGVQAGTTIVGDSTAMVINDREQASVTAFNQHADYAAKGLVLVLGEERVGFEVLQPWALSVATY